MLIEDTSTFRINHPGYISLLLKSGPSDEEKNNSVSHEDKGGRYGSGTLSRNTGGNRAKGEGGRIRDTGRRWGGGRSYRGDERRLEGKERKR